MDGLKDLTSGERKTLLTVFEQLRSHQEAISRLAVMSMALVETLAAYDPKLAVIYHDKLLKEEDGPIPIKNAPALDVISQIIRRLTDS